MPSSPIDEVLEAARLQMLARRSEAHGLVERIRAAADAYLLAVEQDLASQFAQRNGLEFRAGARTARATQELRAALEAVPEVPGGPNPLAASESFATSGSSAATSVSLPPPPPSRPSHPPNDPRTTGASMRPEILLSAPVEELLRELKSTNLDELTGELFRAFAEEFAARARFLQEAFASRAHDVDALSRVIRTLTAVVSKRGLSGVYGLSRAHSGDWYARAEDARTRRLRLQGTSSAGSSDGERTSAPPNPPGEIHPGSSTER